MIGEGRAVTVEQIRALLAAAATDDHEHTHKARLSPEWWTAYVWVAIGLGLRPGEVLG
jgi:hypothetical protein